MIPCHPMTSHSRSSRFVRRTLTIAVGMGVLAYLVFSLMGGDRGWSAKMDLEREIAALERQHTALKAEGAYLQSRVSALDPSHLDLDMVAEQARRVLFYAEPTEILLTPQPGMKAIH